MRRRFAGIVESGIEVDRKVKGGGVVGVGGGGVRWRGRRCGGVHGGETVVICG